MDFSDSRREARILIVDDSPTSIRLVSHFVRDMGSVHFATSGEAGLKMAIDLCPDLILLDMEMPGMDGLETCSQIRKNADLLDVPVIFITAHSSVDQEVAGFAVGAVDFIGKPLSEPIVRARVRTHLTLKQQSDLLRELAMRDGLTGIHNRRAFDERMVLECRRHRRTPGSLGLAIIDIDNFKAYNDFYGHQAGDACLREVAQLIDASARRPGEMAARYGGEEFAVIIPSCSVEEAQRYGEYLAAQVRALALPHEASPPGVVTVSIGVAAGAPESEQADQQLLAFADAALYRAKDAGRNRVIVAGDAQ
ncbi:diguanylate cyclase [Uliginosibacterium sp. 31-16]|uniref:GGDEF domain-containing protein n=1 Tax=Uliginosibacterium sp. 31-16 TaxID=3068315 RepID=UPI00273F8D9E|nr:diguanylate cyclase [Uliginosibacterium sp. 31-16]MDP5240332.1 diguanylate cyclase [Uliginosibacterium sp. 31-16]